MISDSPASRPPNTPHDHHDHHHLPQHGLCCLPALAMALLDRVRGDENLYIGGYVPPPAVPALSAPAAALSVLPNGGRRGT